MWSTVAEPAEVLGFLRDVWNPDATGIVQTP
jgi:hypothetical protein